MGDLTPQEIVRLILGYEELEGADKTLAHQYFQQNPELNARLKWHQQKEADAASQVLITNDFLESHDLSPKDEAAQQESLRLILANLNLNRGPRQRETVQPAGVVSFSHRLRQQARWALPLAAILALTMLIPRGGGNNSWLQNLTITPIELMADGSRGPQLPAPADGVLHTGQAFALDFSLTEDAYVVVFHVDPSGQVSRVYPEAITDTLQPHQGGQEYQIPRQESDEVWVLSSGIGTESFLVVSSTEIPLHIDQVLEDIPANDRGQIILFLQSHLEELDYQVTIYEFQHLD